MVHVQLPAKQIPFYHTAFQPLLPQSLMLHVVVTKGQDSALLVEPHAIGLSKFLCRAFQISSRLTFPPSLVVSANSPSVQLITLCRLLLKKLNRTGPKVNPGDHIHIIMWKTSNVFFISSGLARTLLYGA